ncbi:Similar to Non-histone chromosomal protein 6A; acc. no. P11632 [Pyronema omphalodes CBS 100304]|uniref:Similar to Non-histone chromosomal protein 6A acc. no. P11632 n=1 Tax=Pyronema omphalodes (strain CBS 100304) TaxID=1076935 RepID=U4LUX9_PYROM|nr:Similar to Non-histone chromosomal protein 6A; acc. no. P11632 [Pyronema omphalodes CBS 100304]
MTDLEEVLDRLGLLQYLGRLNDEGFDKWETVLDITEQDLATLNFKLGHRRILQREIASARGYLASQALPINQHLPTTDEFEQTPQEEKTSPKVSRSADSVPKLPSTGTTPTKGTSTGKRKYRRHPKVDENAPEKPPSAYVMFANNVRDSLKGQPLSFTDIAKLVGERWKVLAPEHKQSYEHEAQIAKERFNAELEEYKKTDQYRQYLEYLTEFRKKTIRLPEAEVE